MSFRHTDYTGAPTFMTSDIGGARALPIDPTLCRALATIKEDFGGNES